MRQRGALETRMEFFGNGSAAHRLAALEDDRLVAGFGEIKRGDQAIVTGADDHHRGLGHQMRPPFQSLRICRAASRPGAPMMPPPGCVAEPHMYRFFMGVRYCAHPGTGRKKKSCSSDSSPWKMLPSVSPHSRSRSSGVNTWRCRISSRMLGIRPAIVSTTASPNASRWSSQVLPSESSYGAYCTKQLMTCFPGGAMDGSTMVGMIMSM